MEFRMATVSDLPQIVDLFSDDDIGRDREAKDEDHMVPYLSSWAEMQNDSGNFILVAAEAEEILGALQLTLIAGLVRNGVKRGQIEGVRVKSNARGKSIGRRLMGYAVEMAKARGCGLVQLTTDKRRPDAKRFYESLGFIATHEGMKIIW